MDESELTRCQKCYAYVKLRSRHDAWHSQLEQTIRRLETKAEEALQEARRAKRNSKG